MVGSGKWLGKRPSGVAVEIGHMATVASEQGEGEETANAVASVNDHFQALSDRDIPEKIILVRAGDFLPPNTSFFAGGIGLILDDPPQFLDLLSVDRIRTDADFEAVEVRRIMASRNHDAAVHPEMADREIEHRGGAQADIGHIDTGGHDSSADGILIGFRTETTVPAQGHLPDIVPHGIGADRPAQEDKPNQGSDPCRRHRGHHTPERLQDSLHLTTVSGFQD